MTQEADPRVPSPGCLANVGMGPEAKGHEG